MILAERAGFEPAVGYYPTHAFQIGYEVGEVAQRLCPDGILIGDDDNLTAAIEATRAAIAAHPDRPIP